MSDASANIEKQIRAKIDSFVTELTDLVRQAAIDAVAESLGKSRPGGRAARGSAKVAASSSRSSRKKGEKRSPKVIAKTTERLLAAIKQKPGQRIEELATVLKTTTKDLALPARKLLAAKKITTRGVKRATKYLPK